MYSACKLNKQDDNIQPWHNPFPIWNQSVVPCPVLTVASWPAYRFLKRQVRWSGIPISFRIFQFIVIYTIKDFGIVNKPEIDVFLELSSFSHDPADVGYFILVLGNRHYECSIKCRSDIVPVSPKLCSPFGSWLYSECDSESVSHSVASDFLPPHGL